MDASPLWQPSGLSPVFLGTNEEPAGRLIGYTKLKINVDTFYLMRRDPSDATVLFSLGQMQRFKHQGFWAYHLIREVDAPYIPSFTPVFH